MTEEKKKEVKKSSSKYTKENIEDGKLLAVLSYIGILALIPYFVERDNPYIKDHAKIGVNLFLIEAIIGVGLSAVAAVCAMTIILLWISIIIAVLEWAFGIVSIVISVIGIINACNGEVKELPIVGKYNLIK